MKRTLAMSLLCLISTLCLGQTHISSSPVSNDAIAPSIAIFTSTEQTPRTIVRIAYLDGVQGSSLANGMHVRDYDSAMNFIGERTITISGPTTSLFSKPRLSRDGRGLTFFGNTEQVDDALHWPYFRELSTVPYTGSASLVATPAPYAGIDVVYGLGGSTSVSTDQYMEPPGISNYVDGSFHIVFIDMLRENSIPEVEDYIPIMHWDTGDSVDDIEWSSGCVEPGINGDADYLVFVDGGQVMRAGGSIGDWSSTLDMCSYYQAAGNFPSRQPEIDSSGDTVVFISSASNLDPDDSNGIDDVYVWTAANGPQLPYADPGFFSGASTGYASISPDGQYVSFQSTNMNHLASTVDYNTRTGPFIYRVQVGSPSTLTLISRSNTSRSPVARNGMFSDVANGGHVVFQTADTGLASGDTRSGIDIIENH